MSFWYNSVRLHLKIDCTLYSFFNKSMQNKFSFFFFIKTIFRCLVLACLFVNDLNQETALRDLFGLRDKLPPVTISLTIQSYQSNHSKLGSTPLGTLPIYTQVNIRTNNALKMHAEIPSVTSYSPFSFGFVQPLSSIMHELNILKKQHKIKLQFGKLLKHVYNTRIGKKFSFPN